jgi:hypothetical protein
MDNLKMSERPRVVVVSSLAAYGGATQVKRRFLFVWF